MCENKIKKGTSDEDSYLGSYTLEKCDAYGALGIIDTYNNQSVGISLKEKTDDVVVTSYDGHNLGILYLSEVDKKSLILYLRNGWCSTLYSCRLMIIDKKPKVGIWINEK